MYKVPSYKLIELPQAHADFESSLAPRRGDNQSASSNNAPNPRAAMPAGIESLRRVGQANGSRTNRTLSTIGGQERPVGSTPMPPINRHAIGNIQQGADQECRPFALCSGKRFFAVVKPAEGTVTDFHQMLMNLKLGGIVDLTHSEEKRKGPLYTPHVKKSIQSLDLKITCEKTSVLGSRAFRLKQLQFFNGKNRHTVNRLHFKKWADHEIVSEDALIKIASAINGFEMSKVSSLVVVYGEGGKSKAGTLISFVETLERMKRDLNDDLIEKDHDPCSVENIKKTFNEVLGTLSQRWGDQFVPPEKHRDVIMRALYKAGETAKTQSGSPVNGFAPGDVSRYRADLKKRREARLEAECEAKSRAQFIAYVWGPSGYSSTS